MAIHLRQALSLFFFFRTLFLIQHITTKNIIIVTKHLQFQHTAHLSHSGLKFPDRKSHDNSYTRNRIPVLNLS
jgi:hypothetical protein